MKAKILLLLSLLFCSQFVFFVNAAGGTKSTTFSVGEFGIKLCDLEVHFSWDSDSWKAGDKHQIGFSFAVKNINPNVVELNLNIKEIVIRLDSEIFYRAVDLKDEDVSTQVTQLVWRQDSTTLFNTPRSFSFEVKTPKPDKPSTEDTSVELYYVVQLYGNYYYQEVGGTNLHGHGQIYEYISNEGSMSGGIEDPVWITMKAEPTFPWLYVVVVIIVSGIAISGLSAFLIVRKRKLKTPPPPS